MGKDIAQYVTKQALDREKRESCTEDTSRREKGADEIQIQMARIDTDKAMRVNEIQIAADRARDQAKIAADKALDLREFELQAQAQVNTNATSNLPPPNRDAKSPKLPSFTAEKEELDSNYLLHFKRYECQMGETHVGYQAECITVRKSHGCKHQDVQ